RESLHRDPAEAQRRPPSQSRRGIADLRRHAGRAGGAVASCETRRGGRVMAPMAANARPVRLPLGATGFVRVSGVSRETLDKLAAYVDLLAQWNRRINLVGANTMGDVWRRHILDCAQLAKHLPRHTRVVVDLGSGAGLPGLILAAIGVPEMHLVESDLRKAAFLR